jgi:hypothetical protein
MSYETYHAIKQQPNGDFVVVSKCSNDDQPPREWVMSYYRTEFPDMTNEQRVAMFLLQGQYCGSRYYPEKWKRLDAMTTEYSKKVFEIVGVYPEYNAMEHINGLAQYIKVKTAEPKEPKTSVIIWCSGIKEYVCAMTMKSKRVGLCSDRDSAKVFRMTQSDIDKLVKRLPAYMQAETINV